MWHVSTYISARTLFVAQSACADYPTSFWSQRSKYSLDEVIRSILEESVFIYRLLLQFALDLILIPRSRKITQPSGQIL